MLSSIKVISLGGSLIAPDGIDTDFLVRFQSTIRKFLDDVDKGRIILVCGGGALARSYQGVYRELMEEPNDEGADWIGIAATRLNAELIRQVFVSECPLPVVQDPTAISVFPGRILVASGWKPGFSTDFDAVILAQKFSCNTIINLSDIPHVFSADPKTDPEAIPLESLSWSEYRSLVGDKWTPGINAPFDPVAAEEAQKACVKVIVASGKEYGNLLAILRDETFVGTLIGPG